MEEQFNPSQPTANSAPGTYTSSTAPLAQPSVVEGSVPSAAPQVMSAKSKRKSTTIIAIVLGVLLMTGTAYMYFSTRDETVDKKPDPLPFTDESKAAVPANSNEALDSTDQAVDDALSASSDSDFPESDISDSGLGL